MDYQELIKKDKKELKEIAKELKNDFTEKYQKRIDEIFKERKENFSIIETELNSVLDFK